MVGNMGTRYHHTRVCSPTIMVARYVAQCVPLNGLECARGHLKTH